jgi:three-Cys-motif partner protein
MGREAYVNREQALVKHFVLKNYLQRLAMKVANFAPGTTLNYLDGFSGPWDAIAENWTDSSPYIAAAELKKAQSILGGLAKPVQLDVRCMFVESDPAAFTRLQEVVKAFDDTTIVTYCGEFDAHIDHAVEFARFGGKPFGFAFIDPTGWTGYGLKKIAPLLRVRPSEVLINFMTKDILRFIDDVDSSALQSFQDLFGETSYRESWRGLEGLDREDAIVRRYCEQVKAAGGFSHCTSAVIVNPSVDRTHYHLVYATRSVEGLVTFRDVERQAAETQRTLRGEVRARKELERSAQMPLFHQEPADSGYVDLLRERYRGRAEAALLAHLAKVDAAAYDDVLCDGLLFPFVSETIFKQILKRLQTEGTIEISGLKARERVPKRKVGVRVRLTNRQG